jgi:hypothetical protein
VVEHRRPARTVATQILEDVVAFGLNHHRDDGESDAEDPGRDERGPPEESSDGKPSLPVGHFALRVRCCRRELIQVSRRRPARSAPRVFTVG